MKPATALREVRTSEVTESTTFDISSEDSAHLMSILRDSIYSDKILAVIREYSANAWDAHREAGKGDVPIKVTLPTEMEPLFTVRDYGHGLSQHDVLKVFTKYGKSTKRNSNEAVGMLGIGSKSGFAYSDTFTITSFHGGKKSTYVAVLDPSDKGELKLLDEQDSDETGVEIQLPVKVKDIPEFAYKASRLFYYFNPRPETNVDVQDRPAGKGLVHGEIYESQRDWVAIMGCVAYRVNVQQLQDHPNFDYQLVQRLGGALNFNIGEVHIAASREELKYSDQTKDALVIKLNALVDEYVQHTLDQIEKGGFTPWEKRLKAQVLHRLSLPVPKDTQDLFAQWVSIKTPPVSFAMQRVKNIVNSIYIRDDAKLYIQDDKRNLKGFGLREHETIIKPAPKKSITEVRAELDLILAQLGLTGIPVELLSTKTWIQTSRGWNGKTVNIKHRVKTFKLLKQKSYYKPYSNNWEPETDRDATDKDVYVVISGFVPNFYFYEMYKSDARVAEAFGITMPEVYGYKATAAKPDPVCVGIEYREWRKGLILELKKNATVDSLINTWRISLAANGNFFGYNGNALNKEAVEKLTNNLGVDHPITSFAIRALEAKMEMNKLNFDDSVIEYLNQNVKPVKDEDKTEMKLIAEEFVKSYPMLAVRSDGLSHMWSHQGKLWMDYIKLVDSSRKDG